MDALPCRVWFTCGKNPRKAHPLLWIQANLLSTSSGISFTSIFCHTSLCLDALAIRFVAIGHWMYLKLFRFVLHALLSFLHSRPQQYHNV